MTRARARCAQIHGREWATAAAAHAGIVKANNLPGIDSNSTGWSFDPSVIYGFDEAVLLLLIFLALLCCTAAGTKVRRAYRRCTSEEAKQQKDADTLGLIGTAARQIALDLDSVGVLRRPEERAYWSTGGSATADSSGPGGLGDLSSQLNFSELDALMAGLTNRSESNDASDEPKGE